MQCKMAAFITLNVYLKGIYFSASCAVYAPILFRFIIRTFVKRLKHDSRIPRYDSTLDAICILRRWKGGTMSAGWSCLGLVCVASIGSVIRGWRKTPRDVERKRRKRDTGDTCMVQTADDSRPGRKRLYMVDARERGIFRPNNLLQKVSSGSRALELIQSNGWRYMHQRNGWRYMHQRMIYEGDVNQSINIRFYIIRETTADSRNWGK